MLYLATFNPSPSTINYVIFKKFETCIKSYSSSTDLLNALESFCSGSASTLISSNRLELYGSVEKALHSKKPNWTIVTEFTNYDDLKTKVPELFI